MEKSSMKNQYLATTVGILLAVMPMICFHTAEADTGACYGTLGDNLPSATDVIGLCNKHKIRRIRLYNPNPSVLQALKGHRNISVVVGVANEDIQGIARDAGLAESWVRNNVLQYGDVSFRCIAVGNEISPSDGAGIAPSVAPAMRNIYSALSAAGLGKKVKVSTALSMGVLAQSYPPSAGAFRSECRGEFIDPILEVLAKTKSPFLVNVYPYFAYTGNTKDIRLDYALFTSPSTVVSDGRYRYQNLFDAMVDAVHAALERAGRADVEVVVSETGWPSAGGTATTVANAKSYNSNLIKSVKKGTPRRPGKAIETYIFDLIDENQKSPELEKHWGVFLANKRPKYHLSFE